MIEDRVDPSGSLSFSIDKNRVGWLTFDRPGSSQNILSAAVLDELDHLLSDLESRIANGQMVALVLQSAKPKGFIAGADVREISAVASAEEGRRASAAGQRIFSRVERLRVPTIAAVQGVCLGGGTELVLACDYRILSDSPDTTIGLPEVRLGILPGFGGTVRLPRLCGIQNALGMILTGKPISARRAKRMGLADRVAASHRFEDDVRIFVRDVAHGKVKPGGFKKTLGQRLLEDTPPGRAILFAMARRGVLKETGGNYPAPLRALETVRATYTAKPQAAYAIEARALGELAATEVSRSLVRVFLLSQGARKAVPEEQLDSRRPVERAAVIGAGVMGGAIAQLIASRDVPVTLKDINQEALDSGMRHASALLKKAAAKRVFTSEQASLKFALITGTLAYEHLLDVGLVIEAVIERMPVKQGVVHDLEMHLDRHAVIATNTSSLSVTELASAAIHPERVIGLHFFNPVHKMPLVEVVPTAETSSAALARAFGFVLDMGKTPVIVADRPGFLVNRLLAPYLNEAGFLLEQGTSVGDIDRAMTSFGMPMGPCRLLDEIGFDVAEHVSREMSTAFGERLRSSGVIELLRGEGRLGRKNDRGFYLYESGKETGPDPALKGVLRRDGSPSGANEIRERCLYAMVNEAALALQDEVVAGPDAVDLAMIMGTGFPPFRGGLLRWADRVGLQKIVTRLSEMETEIGSRFKPAPRLLDLVRDGESFTDSA
ncbi:MAG: 3-hydroxyacyl-CoA dehydrogenase NAD-binding domain-containing protein [Gemmatimonadota bacterium]